MDKCAKNTVGVVLVCTLLAGWLACVSANSFQYTLRSTPRRLLQSGNTSSATQPEGPAGAFPLAPNTTAGNSTAKQITVSRVGEVPPCDFNLTKWDPLKPGYHLTIPYGWMNDPNGMFQLRNRTHVFFQYNPWAPVWGAPYWGHVVTDDLAHWRWLPVALSPSDPYDSAGAWSGSAAIVDDEPVLFYTGAVNKTTYFNQTQSMAFPANTSDPYYKNWNKLANNPILIEVPPGGNNSQFRDPTTPFQVASPITQGDYEWVTIIGAQNWCLGSASIYTAPNITGPWNYTGSLYSQLAQHPELNGQCPQNDPALPMPRGARPYGGSCEQFGECRMWECPDFFEVVPGINAFKYSDQYLPRYPFGLDWYVLGNGALNWSTNPAQNELTVFDNQFDNKPYEPKLIDYGSVYASRTFRLEDGRLMWMGWVFEASKGCNQSCGAGSNFTAEQGWQGMQTLLRDVGYDEATNELLFYPAAETELLRGELLFNDSLPVTNNASTIRTIANMTADTSLDANITNSTARQFEVQLNFTVNFSSDANVTQTSVPFLVGVRITHGDPDNYTDVFLNGTMLPASPTIALQMLNTTISGMINSSKTGINDSTMPDMDTINMPGMNNSSTRDALVSLERASTVRTGAAVIQELYIVVDRSHTGGMTITEPNGGPVTLPSKYRVTTVTPLTLSVFIDHSIIEAFAQGGRGRVASRVYPMDATSSWGLGLIAGGTPEGVTWNVEAKVWDISNMWLDPICS